MLSSRRQVGSVPCGLAPDYCSMSVLRQSSLNWMAALWPKARVVSSSTRDGAVKATPLVGAVHKVTAWRESLWPLPLKRIRGYSTPHFVAAVSLIQRRDPAVTVSSRPFGSKRHQQSNRSEPTRWSRMVASTAPLPSMSHVLQVPPPGRVWESGAPLISCGCWG